MKSKFDTYRDNVWNYLRAEYTETMDIFYSSLNTKYVDNKLILNLTNSDLNVEIVNNIYLNGAESIIEDCYSDGRSVPIASHRIVTLFMDYFRVKGVKV